MCGNFKLEHFGERCAAAVILCTAATLPYTSAAATTNALNGSFVQVSPAGSLVYSHTASNSIAEGVDCDVFTVTLDPGQAISLSIKPDSGLRLEVFLENSLGVVTTVVAGTTGEELVLQEWPVDVADMYAIGVSGVLASSGDYGLEIVLNAALEHESRSGPPNNASKFAQMLSPVALETGVGGGRAAVLGALEGEVDLIVDAESWDDPTFGPQWTTFSSDFKGRFFITGLFTVQDLPRALWMDRAPTGTFTLNEAIWEVDLSGVAQPELRFFQAERNDEEHSFQTAGVEFVPFLNHFNADGVAISDNGTNWQPIYTPSHQDDAVWIEQRIDLADRAADAGMTLTSNFLIKFQQYDDFSIPADGRGYDAISIVTLGPDEDWYGLDVNVGDRTTLVLEWLSGGPIGVELFAPDGITALATGVVAGAARRVIDEVAAATGATHYARVSGSNGVYSLTALRGVSWDHGSNFSVQAAQSIQDTREVLGYFNAASPTGEYYAVSAATTDVVIAQAVAPAAGPFEFVNLLDPAIELLGPGAIVIAAANDLSPSNRNAGLLHSVESNGTYTLCIYATNASPGEYALSARILPREDDSDSDGLPDFWEIFHGLDPLDDGTTDPDQGAAGDPDGDGIDNAGEFEDDTSPFDPTSAFLVTGVGDTGGSNSIVITVATEPAATYRIQFTDDGLTTPTWSDFANTGLTVGTWVETSEFPSAFTFHDDFTPATSGHAPTNNRRAYRVISVQP